MNSKLSLSIGDSFDTPFGGSGGSTIGDFIGLVLNAAIAIAGIAMIALLIFAGISMISGAGSDDPEKTAKGRKAATTAVIGFVIIIFAYLIVRLIEIIFVGPTGPGFLTNPGV